MMQLQILGRDPRCKSETVLIPQDPLPYISRRALGRVPDRLPIPTQCPYCDDEVELVNNSEIYRKSFGKWPYAYLCINEDCKAYVGLHPETDLPLGTLADRQLRDARKLAKEWFVGILINAYRRERGKAYKWLANEMGLSRQECHFAFFDLAQCHKAIDICQAHPANNYVSIGERHVSELTTKFKVRAGRK